MLISKIISGGQTGVDRGAIEAALELGFPYGGLISKGRLAEDGIVPLKFDKKEVAPRKDYLFRTEWNVAHSDATLILNFGRELSGGTKRTADFCEKHGKPYWVEDLNRINETDRGLEFWYWLEAEFWMKPVVLNVAGPRESKSPGIQVAAKAFIAKALRADDGGGSAGRLAPPQSAAQVFRIFWILGLTIFP